MVIVTLEDFNRACKVDVEVKQHVDPRELDADGNFVDKPPSSGDEVPEVEATLKAVDWADEIQVTLFGEGHVFRTRELLERQLEAYYQWINTPDPPNPPKDPNDYIRRVQLLEYIDRKVAEGFQEKASGGADFSEQQRKAYKSWQETEVYSHYILLIEEYLESLKPPPPPRDWSQKEYPELLELQNEQFLLWYKANRAYLENLLKPEIPVEETPPPPPDAPPSPKDINVYIRNLAKMKEIEDYWQKKGPYVFWPDRYDPNTYYLELQRYWMGKWEYTEEYLKLYRGVIRKKMKKIPWRKLKWWEWKPISDLYKQEREPKSSWDYAGLPKRPLSSEYKRSDLESGLEKPDGEAGEETVTPASVLWDFTTKAPYKSMVYNTELADEPNKMPENRIFWEREPRPVNMDAIYKETYEVIVKTQPNFI